MTTMDEGAAWLDAQEVAMIGHPGGTLTEHLTRVALRLRDWGFGEVVQVAGLTHAAYGTAGFDDALIGPDRRAELRAAVGAEAEEHVYLYGSCDRSTSYPQFPGTEPFVLDDRFTGETHLLDEARTRVFVAVTFANEIDVMRHNADLARRHGEALHALAERSLHWLPEFALPDLPLLRGDA